MSPRAQDGGLVSDVGAKSKFALTGDSLGRAPAGLRLEVY
jgi:hypothetical protein